MSEESLEHGEAYASDELDGLVTGCLGGIVVQEVVNVFSQSLCI